MSGRASNSLADLGHGYGLAGKRAEALAIARELEERYVKRKALGYDIAEVYMSLGEKEQALAWLEKDFQTRSGYLPGIAWDIYFDPLRSDSRFASLLRRMGLRP